MRHLFCVCVWFSLLLCPAYALDNGLGQTPPLAWSSWNYFNEAVNESVIRQIADALVDTGLADAGFRQVNIDNGYLIYERHPTTGELQVNATKFPSGMRNLADYLNTKGLKLGLYSDIGNGSCGSHVINGTRVPALPGSWGHYDLDAQTFADWHVDYLKVDFCGFRGPFNFSTWMDPQVQLAHWQMLRDALNKTGRRIYYSICPHGHVPPGGTSKPWYKKGTGYVYAPPLSWTDSERKETANSILVEYTNLFDIWYAEHWSDFRDCPGPKCHTSSEGGLLTNVDAMIALTKPQYSGRGAWADADMLDTCNFGKGGADAGSCQALIDALFHDALECIGRYDRLTRLQGGRHDGGMTMVEYRASYSIWAVLASPIIISADVRTIAQEHPWCLAMLKNRELIAVSQDPLAMPGRLVRQATNSSSGEVSTASIVEQVFSRPLEASAVEEARAVVLFNRGEAARNMSVTWAELAMAGACKVRDIWANNEFGADRGVAEGQYEAEVQKHGVVMIKVNCPRHHHAT